MHFKMGYTDETRHFNVQNYKPVPEDWFIQYYF